MPRVSLLCLDFAHYRSIHHTDRHMLFFALLHEHTSLCPVLALKIVGIVSHSVY